MSADILSSARTPYDVLGGVSGVRHLVDRFYDAMETDPAAAGLRSLHGDDLDAMRERLTDWMAEWMGGPLSYAALQPGRPCLMAAHVQLTIGAAEVDQWMACMRRALAATEMPDDWRDALDRGMTRICQALRNA